LASAAPRTVDGREGARRALRAAEEALAYQRREAMDWIAAGEAVAEVARTFGIDRATVYRLKP
jgi:DNA-binding CsgD family transcriptional regulator